MLLTEIELRVLACLVEKSFTTPDQYPLTTNALTAACNQKTSREPVTDYSAHQVDDTMRLLRDAGWARSIRGSGNRSFKHRHVLDEKIPVGPSEQALLAVLALRGPQSAGELNTRTDRYGTFDSVDDVQATLESMAAREPALVSNVGRQSGQSQDRWIQLIGEPALIGEHALIGGDASSAEPGRGVHQGEIERDVDRALTPVPRSEGAVGDREDGPTVAELTSRIEQLEARVLELERLFD